MYRRILSGISQCASRPVCGFVTIHLLADVYSVKSFEENATPVCFMGYIDRGQRIESRFSRRPIRMSGVVLSTNRKSTVNSDTMAGQIIGRFVMEGPVM